jgi:hypothetical protein
MDFLGPMNHGVRGLTNSNLIDCYQISFYVLGSCRIVLIHEYKIIYININLTRIIKRIGPFNSKLQIHKLGGSLSLILPQLLSNFDYCKVK